jgi:hypothetical protein
MRINTALATASKWTAGAYATCVGAAWLRYGHRAAASTEDADALLDRFMPVYEVAERHHIVLPLQQMSPSPQRATGWLAYVGAVLCAICVPTMYDGPVDYAGFYNAGGWGPAIIANFPPLIWFLVVSVWMIRRREPVASVSARAA